MISLTTRVLNSLVWVITNVATKMGLQFLRLWILWKLLSAREFGINGMTWVAINAFALLQDMGFANALIQMKTSVAEAISITWYANMVIRTAMYALIFAAAPSIAEHLHEPEVGPIMRLAGICLLLGAFGNANEALLRKDFQQKRIMVVDSMETLVLTVVQIAAAFLGYGVWSLAYGAVAGAFTRSILLWWLAPIRVGRIDWKVLKQMWRFGVFMTVSTFGIWLIKNMDYYSVSKFFGAVAMGYYTLAFRLSDFIAVSVVRTLGSVLFPAYAEIGRNYERLRGAWLRSVRYSMALVLPVGITLIMFAPEIVRVFFRKAEGIVEVPMMILTVFALCRTIGVPLGDLAKGIGKPKILTQVVIWHVAVMAPLLFLITIGMAPDPELARAAGQEGADPALVRQFAESIRPGLILVSCCVSGTALFAIGLSIYLTGREVKITVKQIAGALLPPAGAALVMVAVGLGGKAAIYYFAPRVPGLVVLIVMVAIANLTYFVSLLKLFPSVGTELREMLQRRSAERKARGTKMEPEVEKQPT